METIPQIQAINKLGFKDHVKAYTRKPFSLIMLILIVACAVLTVGALIYIILHILINGIPYLTPSLFSLEYNSENSSVFPAIINTLYTVGVALVVAVPIGVFCAIYLVEYAKRGNRLVKYIRLTTETLAGIPSIVFGLFGMIFFVTFLDLKYSILSGALTLAVMILPLVIRSTEEALKAVPDIYREASYGLGANRLRTVFVIVLPSAIPGVLAGVILAVGRIVGETAALIYTAGTAAKVAGSLAESGRTLAIHMYVLASEGLKVNQAYATAVVLLVVVVLLNTIAALVAGKLKK